MSRATKKLPLVAICGRPNVGKSTLFNRLTGKQRAIVHSDEGITRDRSYGLGEYEGRRFRLVDTGGIVEHPVDEITKKMQEQVRAALREALVVIFVLDGQQEITRVDEELRQELFKLAKPVVLAVNKLDNAKLTLNRMDFYSLGLGEPFAISSTHGEGISELLDAVVSHLPEPGAESSDEAEETSPEPTKVAIIGRPNVGKSSFINAILNEDRSIVTDIPGTTRDALNVEFHWKGKDYLFIDTAGMRKKAQIRRDVERYSVNRALRAVRHADVCLLMMDATEGITEQDKRILSFVTEAGAAFILVWTKWDLVGNKEKRLKELADELDLRAPFIRYAPQLTISNLSRLRLFKSFEFIDRVAEQAKRRIGTGELNKFLDALRATPLARQSGRTPKILYATQVSTQPTTFVLFVNQSRYFHFSALRHIENQLRATFGFEGVPIQLELREGMPKE